MPATGEKRTQPTGPSLWPSVVLVFAYAAMVLVCIRLMRTRDAMPAGSELSLPRTVFTVANAASLTGFQQTIQVETYKPFGQRIIFALIVGCSLFSMIVGSAAVVRLLRLPYSMWQIMGWAVGLELIAVLVGLVLIRNAVGDFAGASALGNCGIVIGQVTSRDDLRLHVVILPLAVIGGLGLPVLMELFDWLRLRRRPSVHARVVLAMTATVYLAGLLLLVWLNWTPTRAALRDGSTTSLNARTLGWPVESPATWPRASVWVVMLLMAIGAGPAGTGGGLKTTTAYELVRGAYRALRARPVSRVFGFAMMWLGIYALLVLSTTIVLVSSEPQLAADQILFTAISAVSNVGLSYAPISITGDGLYALSISMMLGRIVSLVILWWAALTAQDADVAVG
jgi:trk system potassium uptake protein TrkH